MADKETKLSIVIATVDRATAKINAINGRLDAITKPTRDLQKAFGKLAENSGLNSIVDGFKGVGSAIGDLLGKVAMVGGVAGVAVAGLVHLVDQFDDLGKKAARLGVSVDFLAEMRDAAERTGVPIDALDSSLETFNQNLGQARAGTGRMAKFLNLVSPALERQLVAAKSNAAAFDILAGAMAKIQDPAKRAALAQKTLGDSALAPLFAKGPKAIKELREHYLGLAGSQEEAASKAAEAGESMKDLHATFDGIKASIVSGLAPALKIVVDRLTEWFQGHRADIKQWAAEIGEKLPRAIQEVVTWIGKAYDKVASFVESVGGIKTVAIAAAAILAGPLLSAVASLSLALLTAVSRVGQLALGMGKLPSSLPSVGGGSAAAAASGTIGGVGVLARTVPFAALGIGLNEVFNRTGLNHEGMQSKILRMQQQAGAYDDLDDESLKMLGLQPQKRRSVVDTVQSAMRGQPDRSELPDLVAQVMQTMDAVRSGANANTEAHVNVHFENAPRGMRATTDPQSTANVDLSMGFLQTGFAP